jgi:hypothetical protein
VERSPALISSAVGIDPTKFLDTESVEIEGIIEGIYEERLAVCVHVGGGRIEFVWIDREHRG